MQTVKLADAREMMRSTETNRNREVVPKPFDLTFITCDEQRPEGSGELKTVKGATLAAMDHQIPKQYRKDFVGRSVGENTNTGGDGRKVPNLFFKLKEADGRIINVFWRLVTAFNGKEIVW